MGKITAALQALPAELTLGQFSVTESATTQTRIYAYLNDGLAITGETFSDPATANRFAISVEPLTPAQLREQADARSGVVLRITAKSGLPLGAIRQTITLRTNLPGHPTIDVPVEGTVIGDISIFGLGWDGDRQVLNLGMVGPLGIQRTLIIVTRGPHRKEVKFKLLHATPPCWK